VWLAESGTPVSTADRDNRELSQDNGTTDGSGNLLRALYTKTDVAGGVTNNDESLEASALTGTGLLLDGADLHDFILEAILKEVIDDLVLLDGQREQVDGLERLDLAIRN